MRAWCGPGAGSKTEAAEPALCGIASENICKHVWRRSNRKIKSVLQSSSHATTGIFFPTVVPPRNNWIFFPYSRPPTGQLDFFPYSRPPTGQLEIFSWTSGGASAAGLRLLCRAGNCRIRRLGRIPTLARARQEASMPGRWRAREAMPGRHQAAKPSQSTAEHPLSPESLLYVLYVLYGPIEHT